MIGIDVGEYIAEALIKAIERYGDPANKRFSVKVSDNQWDLLAEQFRKLGGLRYKYWIESETATDVRRLMLMIVLPNQAQVTIHAGGEEREGIEVIETDLKPWHFAR